MGAKGSAGVTLRNAELWEEEGSLQLTTGDYINDPAYIAMRRTFAAEKEYNDIMKAQEALEMIEREYDGFEPDINEADGEG